jgi:DedD protein
MGLFSFLHKNRQKTAGGDSAYSRAEDEPASPRPANRRKSGKDAAPVDPVLPEKKRARRRLIGAIALVLAAIIGLPMILDSEPKPLADDIAIDIPAKDKAFQNGVSRPAKAGPAGLAPSGSLDRNEQLMAMPTAPAAVKPDAPLSGQAGSTAPVDKATDPETPSAVAVKPARADTRMETRPDPKLDAKLDAKADPKPDSRPDLKSETKSELKPEAMASAKPADKKPSKFVLQVAALATQEKVNELQGKLKSAGVHSYTQKVATESGERIRIRVGPFGNRDEADRMRTKLTKLGLNGTLVPL